MMFDREGEFILFVFNLKKLHVLSGYFENRSFALKEDDLIFQFQHVPAKRGKKFLKFKFFQDGRFSLPISSYIFTSLTKLCLFRNEPTLCEIFFQTPNWFRNNFLYQFQFCSKEIGVKRWNADRDIGVLELLRKSEDVRSGKWKANHDTSENLDYSHNDSIGK